MTVLVSAETVTVRTADRTLLDAVSLGVQTGDRIGILGLNGAGKSTLLQVLAGLRDPDGGRVAIARGARIAMVEQVAEYAPGTTVRAAVLGGESAHPDSGGTADHVWASDASVRAIFDGLGMTNIGLESVIDDLSGGERRRVSLAAALITDADLLILDEPTNHLDMEAIAYLADHVNRRRGAVLAVTHDRWFLDSVAKLTWEVVDGSVEIREGGYSDWVFARAERSRMAATMEERRRNLARKELAWLRRGAPARTSKPRYRIEAAEALIADVPPPRDTSELVALAKHRLGRDVMELSDVSFALPDGRELLRHITHIVGPGDRIAIVGPNGAGKSTLLNVLVGELKPDSGKVKLGKTVRIGFVHQDPEVVDPDLRVLDAITAVAGAIEIEGKSVTASQLAERFGFSPSQQRQQIARLSGGERRRLQLLRVLAAEPNVLVLDEPTNDLDTDTLAALEDLLDSWAGTLIVVSHDRFLVERVADIVLAVQGDGTVVHRPGGVDQYLEDRRLAVKQMAAQAKSSGMTLSSGSASSGASSSNAVVSPAAPPHAGSAKAGSPHAGSSHAASSPTKGAAKLGSGELRQLRKDLQRLDKRMESLRRKKTAVHGKLTTLGADYESAAALNAELKDLAADLATTELEWLRAAEKLER
ncbi:MAG: ABC-F family ATP-binding cassette domain-containing protein [Nakamurella sp.]